MTKIEWAEKVCENVKTSTHPCRGISCNYACPHANCPVRHKHLDGLEYKIIATANTINFRTVVSPAGIFLLCSLVSF